MQRCHGKYGARCTEAKKKVLVTANSWVKSSLHRHQTFQPKHESAHSATNSMAELTSVHTHG